MHLSREALPAQASEQSPVPIALRLARVLQAIRYEDLPPEAIAHSKMILASTIASAAAGTEIGSARIVRELAKEQGGTAEARIWFDGQRVPIVSAARVNSMLSDAAASDDSDLRNVAHTGTSLTAVGLAIAEKTGASGRDVLTAIVAGYESAGRFGDAIRGGRPGLHASLIVAFGSVVTASRLLGLTPEQMAHAIGLTSTTMGGILVGTDSWAREYMAGNAAMCGVNAALAARKGFTVNSDLVEGPGGFLATMGNPQAELARFGRPAGPDWDIVRFLAIKLVPGAHAIHSSAEAAINAATQGNVLPQDVARILVSGPRKTSVTYDQRPPRDMIEAIHSMPYFVCTGIVDRDFGWIHVTPEKIASPEVAKLIPLVEYDAGPSGLQYNWNWGGTVTIVTKRGERYTSTVDAPKGSGPRGIQWTDVKAKYDALMPASKLPARRQNEIFERIQEFDQVESGADFTRLLG